MILRLSESKCINKLVIIGFFLFYFFQFCNNPVNAGEKQKNPFNSAYPSLPVSYSESSFAPFINPVLSEMSPDFSMSYMMQNFEDRKDYNHFFLLNYGGFILSYSWIENLYNYNDALITSDAKLFTIGKSFFLNNMFGFGANYLFSNSNNDAFDDYRSLTLGMLFRPTGFLSLAYVSRDINNPKVNKTQTSRSDVYSLSLRPVNYFTLSVDAVKYERREINKSDIQFSTTLHLKYNISVFAGLTKNKDFTFGLLMPLGINGEKSSSLILDGYGSNRYDINSYCFGITLSGEKTIPSIFQSKRFLKIILNKDIGEIKIERLLDNYEVTFYDLSNAIKTAGNDESISGIMLQIDNIELGFAQIQELREQIKFFRQSGKNIYAVLNAIGNREYYLASACDKIYYNPANVFSITGLMAEVFFFKGVMDKIGVKFESVSRGPYKSYPEPYTKEHMSREFRENLTALISDLNEQFLGDIANDRSISREKIGELLRKGIFTPEEAVNNGFVDYISYSFDAEKKYFKEKHSVGLNDYVEEKTRTFEWGPRPEIAVIYVSGAIVRGRSQGYNTFVPKTTGDETYAKALTIAFEDPRVKAVVIRVDSGGGSSLASELMWHYLISLKNKYKKPVVFSFGNTAASGGYYIACTGDRIIGNRGSVTGSIGVVAGKLSLKELYARLGINKDVIKMSEFADIFSESKDMSAEERKIFEQGVDYVYNRFTQKVSQARGIEKEQIDKVAEGRVFTGGQAKENRLIDSFGGLLAAIDMAKRTAKIKDEYTVRHLPEISVSIMEFLGLGSQNSLFAEKIKSLMQTFEFIDFNNEYSLYYFPYRIEIK
ncbi:MAG: signal peptide peptidase SppA [Spirochaetota bacterium]